MNSKISFTTMATPELDLPAQVLVAKKYGFHGIDFRVGEPGKGEIPENLSEEQAQQVTALLDGLQLPGLLCYNRNILAGQEEMVASLHRCSRTAGLLGCPMFRVFTGRIQTPEELDALCEAIRVFLGQDHSNIKLGMQIHKNNGVTVAQALQVCRTLQNPRVGIILSPDQSLLAGETWEHLIPELAKHVQQIYVADLDAAGEFSLIGEGVIDYARIIKALKEHGFDGFVTLKWEKCWLPQLPKYPEAFSSFIGYLESYAL